MAEDNAYSQAVAEAYTKWRAEHERIGAEYARKMNALMAERQRAERAAKDARETEIMAAMYAADLADRGYDTEGYE